MVKSSEGKLRVWSLSISKGKSKVQLTFPDKGLLWTNGQTGALLIASEIVVLGQVRGNCQASDHLDIRSEGSMSGDAIVSRISIADGAFVKGSIDVRRDTAHSVDA